jgi:hypothetical protein
MREVFFAELVKEVMGPREGASELLDKDPRNEYVTGILEPKDYDRDRWQNLNNSDIGTFAPDEEHDEDESDPAGDFGSIPTNLDPYALPKSIGLSFVVCSQNKPVIDFCAIWARYSLEGGRWRRKCDKFLAHDIDVTQSKASNWSPAIGVQLILRTKKESENSWHVSIFMINNTKVKSKFLDTSELIFQPQIRVHFHEGVTPLPVDKRRFSEDEQGQLELLYGKLQCLARGHMCGATWQEIDPERPFKGSSTESPFLPEDVKLLSVEERKLFCNPNVRTEFLPTYTVTQTTVEAQEISGWKKDETDAFGLSEIWDYNNLSRPLNDIANEYEKWIAKQEGALNGLDPASAKIAKSNINDCRASLKRIREGIGLLQKDDVRLAFCFMNQAMNLQSTWTRAQNLVWRPFQLAFILQCIPSLESKTHSDRDICDLLWYPTGGGKTEAYLGLMIFVIALRRLRNTSGPLAGGGTVVLSRYTLRLLTIQQFRRTLAAITACEYLRMADWKPSSEAKTKQEKLWGGQRFSIGLWVGSNVTPNNLVDRSGWDNALKLNRRYVGAVGILKYAHKSSGGPAEQIIYQGEDPAQVLKCPSCSTVLAIPSIGLSGKDHEIYWVISAASKPTENPDILNYKQFKVKKVKVERLPNPGFYILHAEFSISSNKLLDDALNEWRFHIEKTLQCRLECSAASRPGYFIRTAPDVYKRPIDFEIHCPNPACKLNSVEWWELVPAASGEAFCIPLQPFAVPGLPNVSHGIPIPAYTVDAQIYARCPSIIVATVDKFARLPFEPHASAIFGNVNRYDSLWGYNRDVSPADTGKAKPGKSFDVPQFEPPDLILQDELHLIEGPLGSMVGLYETAVDALATGRSGGITVLPKYIASTATTKQAVTQIRSLFNRKLAQFPASGLTSLDNFFSSGAEGHPLDEKAGRLYVGVCCPGKGPQTPPVRIWSSLLQAAKRIRESNPGKASELAPYWTVVGYFNAIRELAQARSLYRNDIPEWMKHIDGAANARSIDDTNMLELHSNIGSAEVSAVLERLEREETIDAVMATSMFGTGVDIDRLSLMVVHGQPKTTASYIQATGRVGRKNPGLVITFLRSTRPRDLDHYEFFTGYHRALHKYVEPVTVAPFSPRACDRALGPVAVGILRNGKSVESTTINPAWAPESGYWKKTTSQSGSRIMKINRSAPELRVIAELLDKRAEGQPGSRRRAKNATKNELESFYEKWENVAKMETNLLYAEPSFNYIPDNAVVLGDEQHLQQKKRVVAESTPQSMRELESTTRFWG